MIPRPPRLSMIALTDCMRNLCSTVAQSLQHRIYVLSDDIDKASNPIEDVVRYTDDLSDVSATTLARIRYELP